MTRAAITALGLGQCVNWGVLYYAFAVLVLPIQHELAVDTWVVTGALSLALLISALMAPTIGRWADLDRGPVMMQVGGLTGAALLVAWTLTTSVSMLYVIWTGLGMCMAATLYEPAFAIVGRAFADPAKRLRALAAVTLFGGLASTLFLPLTAWLVDAFGWRGAVLVLAMLLAISAGTTHFPTFRTVATSSSPGGAIRSAPFPDRGEGTTSPQLLFIALAFALASLSSTAFTTNLIPALGERGVSAGTAAALGGLLGVMQLPGRALLMNGSLAASPSALLAVSLALHAAGLGIVAAAPSTSVAALGTMVLALGAGLTTLVRPYLVHTLFALDAGGHLNGRIAMQQQLARAAGPLVVAWVASRVGYSIVFTLIASAFVLLALASGRVLRASGPFEVQRGTA